MTPTTKTVSSSALDPALRLRPSRRPLDEVIDELACDVLPQIHGKTRSAVAAAE